MKRSEIVLSAICGFLCGVIVGFLLAPMKKGDEAGNDSSDTTYLFDDEEITEE